MKVFETVVTDDDFPVQISVDLPHNLFEGGFAEI